MTQEDSGRPPKPVSARPTPVRQAEPVEPVPTEVAEPTETRVFVDGQEWTVRVLGRSGGASVGHAPLILLGFCSPDEPDGAPEREAVVAARRFSDLTEDRLLTAFRESRPPLPDDRPRPFFADRRGGRSGKPRRQGRPSS